MRQIQENFEDKRRKDERKTKIFNLRKHETKEKPKVTKAKNQIAQYIENPKHQYPLIRGRQFNSLEFLLEIKQIQKLAGLRIDQIQIKDLHIFNSQKFESLRELSISNRFEKVESCPIEAEGVNLSLYKNLSSICLAECPSLKQVPNIGPTQTSVKLYRCGIPTIEPLSKMNLQKLHTLSLECNKIIDIELLRNVNLDKLVYLDLSYNLISDIRIFSKTILPSLEKLYLGHNYLSSFQFIPILNYGNLKILDLFDNWFTDIKYLLNCPKRPYCVSFRRRTRVTGAVLVIVLGVLEIHKKDWLVHRFGPTAQKQLGLIIR